MKFRYFVVAREGRLRRLSRQAVRCLWLGLLDVRLLGCLDRKELRLVSVQYGPRLQPRKVYLLRLPLSDGHFTHDDYLTLQIFTRSDCVTPREVVEHHGAGWPPSMLRQLAVALDVPLARMEVPVRVGGPLFAAAARHLTAHEALRALP
jgi:hypothetical protein